MSLADEILSKNDITVEKVNVPEWSMDVYLKPMSGRDRDQWEAQYMFGASQKKTSKDMKFSTADQFDNQRAKLLVRCICDESGNLLFDKNQAGDLGKKSAAALDRLFEVACKINKISDEDLEDLEKN